MNDNSGQQELAMLHSLRRVFGRPERVPGGGQPVDEQLVLDLETMVVRTQSEIDRLVAQLASDAS